METKYKSIQRKVHNDLFASSEQSIIKNKTKQETDLSQYFFLMM